MYQKTNSSVENELVTILPYYLTDIYWEYLGFIHYK